MSQQIDHNQTNNRIQIREADEEMEIDLVELFCYYRTKWLPIVAAFFLGAVVVGAVSLFLIKPKYEATAKLYMVSASNDSVVDLTDLNLGTSLSSDYAELIKIRPIFEEVIEEQKLAYDYEELLNMVTISSIKDTRILTITVKSTSRDESKNIANGLADKAVTYLPKLMETSAPNIAERAILPEEKCSPNITRNTLIGGLVAAVLVMGIYTVLFLMDDTFKSAEDVEKFFGVMPLTVIPEGDIDSISDKREKEMQKNNRLAHRRDYR